MRWARGGDGRLIGRPMSRQVAVVLVVGAVTWTPAFGLVVAGTREGRHAIWVLP
jgi:hypothetical protein